LSGLRFDSLITVGVRANRGFTLVEIMIVVVIIGLLAAMAIPAFSKVKQNTENSRFMNDLRIFKDALVTCVLETGNMDQGSSSGTVAAQLSEYLNVDEWEEGPIIGGEWDVVFCHWNIATKTHTELLSVVFLKALIRATCGLVRLNLVWLFGFFQISLNKKID